MSRNLLLILVLFFILSAAAAGPAGAWSPASPAPVAPSRGEHTPRDVDHSGSRGKVVVVVTGRTSIDDWEQMNTPHLDYLASRYTLGLMNCKTGGEKIPENTCLTIGAGVPLRAPGTGALAFKESQVLKEGRAGDIYRQRTGERPPEGSIVQLDIARIHNFNKNSSYGPGPGTLGELLGEAGIKTAVLGNSDSLSGLHRQAAFLAMDGMGVVDAGCTGEKVLHEDFTFPGGKRTDYGVLLDKFNSLPRDARFIVIDTGDFARIEDARETVFPSRIPELRQNAARRWDEFLGQVMKAMDLEKDLLLVVSPTPGGKTVRGENMLTPVLAAGNGFNDGLLYSPSTKRPGIIRNTDLTASILKYFNVTPPPGITGRQVQVMPGQYSFSSLVHLQEELAFTNQWRRPVLQNYILIQLILLGASLLFIFWKKPVSTSLLKPVYLAVMSVPLALLVLPLFSNTSPALLLGSLLVLVFIITGLSMTLQRRGNFTPFMFISGLTSLLILVDLLMGAPLQKSSLLGYDPIMGARFYGLGNEYMGVLIGSSIITATSLLARYKRYWRPVMALIVLYFAVTVYIVAAPHLGTNVGGTISSVGAFLITLLLLWDVKVTPRVVGAVLLGITFAVLALIFYDISRPAAQQSHIGRVATLIASGGWSELVNIISRKLSMNIRLVRYTIWSRVFLGSLACLAILFYRPLGAMEQVKKKYPYLFRGFAGVITGCFFAFTFNDSGVVAAATAMIFGAYPLIYLILQETYAGSE